MVGLGVILGLAVWLVMRKRQINTSGSSDEESPYGHKDQDYGGPRGLHASESQSLTPVLPAGIAGVQRPHNLEIARALLG